jgi:hypothetical protein
MSGQSIISSVVVRQKRRVVRRDVASPLSDTIIGFEGKREDVDPRDRVLLEASCTIR